MTEGIKTDYDAKFCLPRKQTSGTQEDCVEKCIKCVFLASRNVTDTNVTAVIGRMNVGSYPR
jgi:hypothetical protein